MSSAVIRVKRRIDEEPLSAFIINCKRPKLDEEEISDAAESILSSKDEISTIVKFAATVESQDENAILQVAKLTKDEAKELAQKVRRYPNALDRSRQQMRDNSHENRFKVVNCYRALKLDNDEAENPTKEITIVDVEKQPSSSVSDNSSNSRPSGSSTTDSKNTPTPSGSAAAHNARTFVDQSNNFVYDLYMIDDAEQHYVDSTNLLDNCFSVQPFDNLTYEDCNDPEAENSDSEDSNQENYFKNDYPDTDDGSSMGSGDMRKAMADINMGSDYDLSSDDDEANYRNGFVYSIDSEAIGFEDDIDYCDVNRYGETYARYKDQSRKVPEAVYNDNESDCSD